MLYLPSSSLENHRGQGLVEYALILVLVSVVVIVIQQTLGQEIGEVYQEVTNALEDTR